MAFISETIPNLLGGVSQQAPQQREVNEVEEMVNCMLRPAEGVVKRPPTVHIAEVAADSTPYTGAFVHPINKNTSERYWVILLDGDLKVFDAVTGVEVPVTFPDGKNYLDVSGTPNEAFRVATFNDTTVIANRESVITRDSELSDSRGQEGLIVIRQGDFSTSYQVQIDFAGATFGFPTTPNGLASYTTPSSAAQNQEAINTNNIASAVAAAINLKWGTGGSNLIAVSRFGSIIHLTPGPGLPDGSPFYLRTFDGLADQGMAAIKDSVQSIDVLPTEAPVGFRIKVEGDPDKKLDDVFYRFTDRNAWQETTQDNIPIALKPETLPLELVANPNFVGDLTAMVPVMSQQSGQFTESSATLLQTADGTASTAAEAIVDPNPGTSVDRFLNLANANGANARLDISLSVDETRIVGPGVDPTDPAGGYYSGDVFTIVVAVDEGVGFSDVLSLPIRVWNPTARRFSFSVPLTTVPMNSDVRLRVTSEANNIGALIIAWDLSQSYSVADAVTIHVPSSHYAPGSQLDFTLNGTAFSDTFTAGGTQAEYLTRLKTEIEAYGGTPAVSVTIGTGELFITNVDGTEPAISGFSFDDNLDLSTQLFNGSADFVTLGATIGDTLVNTTTNASGIITAVAVTIITTGAGLSGGNKNVWRNGDKTNVKRTTTAFTCRRPQWAKRLVGTEETNKWPSFLDKTINEVAFLKNRLVFLSDENVVMSEVDEFFNFFRTSTLDVLDSDRIDVALSGNKTSALHSASTWNETLLVWSELGQFVVNGEPFLSPNTVKREGTTAYVNTRKVKPVTSERALYFMAEGKEFSQLWDYSPTTGDAKAAEASRLSVKVPRYIPGVPRGLLAISDPEIVLVQASGAPDSLFVFSHLTSDRERIMSGWHKWTFSGVSQILGIGSIDNEVSLIFIRDDGAVHLEVLDVWELSDKTLDGQPETPSTPTFNPSPTEIPGDVIFNDQFNDTDLLALSSHVPSPIAPSGAAWEWKVAGGAPYIIDKSGGDPEGAARDSGTGSAHPARLTKDIGDDNIEAVGWTYKSGTTTSGESSSLNICVDAIAISSTNYDRIQCIVDGTNIQINLFSGGMITRSSSAVAHGKDTFATGIEYGIKKVGAELTAFKQDIGGGNRVTLTSMTLTALEQALYEDGVHKRFAIQLTGDGAGGYYMAYATVQEILILGTGTFYTPPLDPNSFPILIGIDEAGNKQTLIPNGDGTVSWPGGEDKSGEDVVIGLPVASSIVLSQVYHRKTFGAYAGQAETRGNTYIGTMKIGIENTTELSVQVDIQGHDSFTQDLSEARSLDEEYFHLRVGGRNTESVITITSPSGPTFRIVGIDWEGTYHNRTRRTS